MNKTLLILRHEFLQTVRRAGYLVMALIVPVTGVLVIFVFRLASGGVPAPPSAPVPGSAGETLTAIVVPGVFSLLLALALMLGATSLVRGLAEEKESRLIEVLFSSVSVRQLLTGKVLALGAAGLLQVLIWLISMPLLVRFASSSFGGILSSMQVPGNFVVLGIVYFVLGYLLFAVLSIGLGAVSSNANEGSQLSTVYTLTSFIPLWFVALLMFFPESPLWIVLSIFPVTAPIQVMLRLGVSAIPAWQLVVSIATMCLAIVAGMSLSIRMFRLHMLAAGSRPKFSELFRGLRRG